jgi:hypothetical protein
MSAPQLDYPTLLVPGSQLWVGVVWTNVCQIQECLVAAHPAMCSVLVSHDERFGWRVTHFEFDRPVWLRHRIEVCDATT